ncbi:hypothetical protein [Streptomyces sp. NBC_00063]|uniref:hypothetical protein n=1 Tax=Streptomyces sp. NBC_00063 TaxID=2975638 RepID=UPI003D73B9AB
MDEVAESILFNSAQAGRSLNLAEMNAVVQECGWTPSGSVAPPGCTRWERSGVRLNLASWGDGWAFDYIFREVWPQDVDELGSEALDSAVEGQLPFCRAVQASLLQALQRRILVSAEGGEEFDESDFVERTVWNINGSLLAVGISGNDVDTPALVMARLLTAPV